MMLIPFCSFRAAGASPSSSETPQKVPKKQTKQPALSSAAPPQPAPVMKPVPQIKRLHETHTFISKSLEGHSDLISCVDLKDDLIISGRQQSEPVHY